MRTTPILLACLAALASPAAAGPAEPRSRPQEVRIPFVNFGAIRTFRTAGEDVLYLQDRRRNWYRAELAGRCPGIESALRIGLDSRFGSTLDSGAILIVEGHRCPVLSLVRSAEPPRRPRN
jgi:uncharacterized protein DUF6491